MIIALPRKLTLCLLPPQDNLKSTAALREALNDFPSVVPLLADKLDLAIPGSIRSHPDFKIETGATYVRLLRAFIWQYFLTMLLI